MGAKIRDYFSLKNVSFIVFLAVLISLSITLLKPKTSSATDLPVVHVSGTLDSNTTWSSGTVYVVDGAFVIPSGLTLNIQEGSIVKFPSQDANQGIRVQSDGTLNVLGASGSPVIFTSYEDDSVGGDSNNDGSSSGAVGDYESAVTDLGGTINVSQATFENGDGAFVVSCDTEYGAVSLTDNTFNNTVGINNCTQDTVVLQRNTFALPGRYTPLSLTNSDATIADISGADKNIFSGSGAAAAIKLQDDTVPADSIWTVDATSGAGLVLYSRLTVDGTLNMDAGSFIKFPSQDANQGVQVSASGTLNVIGTSMSPVIFTSYEDDSVGGDSNNDGTSNGAAGDYTTAVTDLGGTVNISHGTFQYGGEAFGVSCSLGFGTISLTDNNFNNAVGISNCTQDVVSLERNVFAAPAGYIPLSLTNSDATIADISGADKNTFTGSDLELMILLQDDTIPADSTWTVTNEAAPVLYGKLTVDGTLDMDAGSFIKFPSQDANQGIRVQPDGTLNTDGTTGAPVVFTSYKDDSVGGDTNGDSSSTSAAVGDYVYAVTDLGGTINISHTTFENGDGAFEVSCSTGFGAVSLTDNNFNNTVGINNCTQDVVTLERNMFSSPSGYIPLSLTNSDATIADISSVNKNTFAGSGFAKALLLQDDTIPVGSTWTVASGVSPVLHGKLTVDGTLDMDAGSFIKFPDDGANQGIYVETGGTLNATGTSPDPVTFTSYEDDSVGGDTNGDGSSTSAAVDDYEMPLTNNGGTLTMSHAVIEYGDGGLSLTSGDANVQDSVISNVNGAVGVNGGTANFENVTISHVMTGLGVNADDAVTFRGSFDDVSGKYIQACNWDTSGCAGVDAAYNDWGTADGPLNTDPADNLVCGSVAVAPWVHGGTTYTQSNPNLYSVRNCDNSATPDAELDSSVSAFQDRVSSDQVDCSEAIQEACDAYDQALACLMGAIEVASYDLPISLPDASTASKVSTYTSDTIGVASTYINATATASPAGKNLAHVGDFFKVGNLFHALSDAYNACP